MNGGIRMKILMALVLLSAVGLCLADTGTEMTSEETQPIEKATEVMEEGVKEVEEAKEVKEAKEMKEVKEVQVTKEVEKAEEMVEEKVDTVTTESGLKYFDYVVGEGDMPVKGKEVSVHYTGWLANGKKFDSSYDRNQPLTFPLGMGRVIKGWDEGVSTMRVGGKRQLIIPPELGYGNKEVGGGLIPANSTLIFDVELVKAAK
jgi:peptidylprolyl isomerase